MCHKSTFTNGLLYLISFFTEKRFYELKFWRLEYLDATTFTIKIIRRITFFIFLIETNNTCIFFKKANILLAL